MNWKLIFLLSLFGVAMAFAAVFGLTGKLEPIYWLVIFVLYAVIIVKNTEGKYFLHAFLTSVINGVWIGIIHASFFSTYLANNPEMAASYDQMPHWFSARPTIVLFGPVFGALFGLISGFIAWIAGKIVKKNPSSEGQAKEGS